MGSWQSCGFVGRWQSWFCVCSLVLLMVSVGEGINIQVLESASVYELGKVTLKCSESLGMNDTLFRRVGNSVDRVQIDTGVSLASGFKFELNRINEGYYFCGDSGGNSSEVVLVAYPFPEPTIPKVHNTVIGALVRLPCTIPYGVLVSRYSVQWFQGMVPIDTASRPHLSVNDSNAELVFNTVEAEDYGNGYYCVVTVNAASDNFTRQGATISLIVEAPLQLQSGLVRTTAVVGDQVTFTCSASTVPAPTFRWLVRGEQQNVGITSTSELGAVTITTTSVLIMSDVSASSTGQVTCVALHQRAEDVVTVSSTANFIVLTNDFQFSLVIQEGEVFVRSALPVTIPGLFTLAVRFYHSPSDFEESSVFDPSLADTSSIDIKIPREKLPTGFREFAVLVALKVGNDLGPFTTSLSNRINLPDGIQQTGGSQTGTGQTGGGETCDCTGNTDSSSSSSLSNTIVIAVVVVLVVLMVVAIVVLVVGCVFLYNKKVNLEKEYNLSHHSSRGSLPRCTSRTSCSSHGSKSSECSYKCSPTSGHGSSHSINPNAIELGVIEETGEVETSPYENMNKMKQNMTDGPKNVLEFETMDHRVLRQREERRATFMANLDQRAVVPTALREPEPVFPNTHIGAVNPISYRAGHRNRNQGRDSGSSFEDLEDEYLEFSHKSY